MSSAHHNLGNSVLVSRIVRLCICCFLHSFSVSPPAPTFRHKALNNRSTYNQLVTTYMSHLQHVPFMLTSSPLLHLSLFMSTGVFFPFLLAMLFVVILTEYLSLFCVLWHIFTVVFRMCLSLGYVYHGCLWDKFVVVKKFVTSCLHCCLVVFRVCLSSLSSGHVCYCCLCLLLLSSWCAFGVYLILLPLGCVWQY